MLGLGIGLHKNNFVGGIDPAQAIINAFKTRVAAEGGTFEAEQCLKDSLPALIENEPSLLVTPNSGEAGKLFSIIPTNGAADLDVVRNTTATYVGADGLIKTALANVPRLDYSNGSCPSILVEPQRTNLLLRSEEFSNAYWSKYSLSVTSNTINSPNGIQNASKLIPNNSTVLSDSNPSTNVVITKATSALTYTYSIFAKKGELNSLKFWITGSGGGQRVQANFNLNTGTVSSTSKSGSFIIINSNITSYPNNWYRCSLSFTTDIANSMNILIVPSDTTINIGNGTDGVYIWGAQLEAGSNATSYIPTTTTTVTRNADVIGKTGISSLIEQTEGTIYIDANINYTALRSGIFLVIRNQANTNNRLQIFFNNNANNNISFNHVVNGVNNTVSSNIVSSGNVKIAVAYKSGQPTIMYLNGVSYSTAGNIGSFTATIDSMYYGVFGDAGSAPYDGLLGYAMLFKTRLTNTELQQLTTL